MTSAPWVEHLDSGVPEDLSGAAAVFHAFLQDAAAGAPGWPAVTSCNRTLGFAELDALTGRVAGALLRDGVQPGDRVLVALDDGVPLAASTIGALRAGAVVVAVDPAASPQAIDNAVARTAPAVVVAANGVAAQLAAEAAKVVVVRTVDQLPFSLRLMYRVGAPGAWRAGVRTPQGAVRWRDWLAKSVPNGAVAVSPGDPAVVVGAGGDVACTFTHAHLVAGALQLRAWLTDAMPGDDTWLMLLSLSSPVGIVVGLGAAVLLRSRLVLVPGRGSSDALDALRYLRPTYVAADARAIEGLVSDPSLSRSDFHTVRACLVADPLHPDTARQFEQASGVAPCLGYSTPCSAGLVTCNPVNGQRVADSVGLPMPGVSLRLTDDDGRPAADGAEEIDGRLELRGPNVAGDKAWLDTGARARIDAAGYVHLLGEDAQRARPAELRSGST